VDALAIDADEGRGVTTIGAGVRVDPLGGACLAGNLNGPYI